MFVEEFVDTSRISFMSDVVMGNGKVRPIGIGLGSPAVTPNTLNQFSFEDALNLGDDTSDYGADLVCTSSCPGLIDGRIGKGASFDGGRPLITSVARSVLEYDSADFTWATWMRDDGSSNNRKIVGTYCTGDSEVAYLRLSNEGNVVFYYLAGESSNPSMQVVSDVDVDDGEWHHVAVVRDFSGETTTMYVDGVVSGSTTITPTAGSLAGCGGYALGNPNANGNGGNSYLGDLDEFVMYDRAFSAEEIAGLYSAEVVQGSILSIPLNFEEPVYALGIEYDEDIAGRTEVELSFDGGAFCKLDEISTDDNCNFPITDSLVYNISFADNVTLNSLTITSAPLNCVDEDDDGYDAISALCLSGTDCNDENDAQYPGSGVECRDCVDNDGDGLVDWDYDLGCYGSEDDTEEGVFSFLGGPLPTAVVSEYGHKTEEGWSTYDPVVGNQIVYVSSSEGRDACTGFSPDAYDQISNPLNCPKQSVDAGESLVRGGSSDWLLFKRGDVWTDESVNVWTKSGVSVEAPIVIASYGSSIARPLFNISAGELESSNNVENYVVMGQHRYSYTKDPKTPQFTGQGRIGFKITGTRGNIVLEDNMVEYAHNSVEGDVSLPVTFRRNIFFKSYNINGRAQGVFTNTEEGQAPLVFEENLFYQGGWSDEFRFVVTNPGRDVSVWESVDDGSVTVNLQNQRFDLSGLDFTGSTSMKDVAQVIENAINAEIGPNAVIFDYTTDGEVFVLRSDDFKSSRNYGFETLGGGTDLSGPNYINIGSQRNAESTSLDRNMYLAMGFGKLVLRGNIDADGSSGGVQMRMGGYSYDNLYLRNPISITVGHDQNPADTTVSGVIRNNVILGARDIDNQNQGTGIDLVTTSRGAYGKHTITDMEISGNIIAHQKEGTGNIVGITFSLPDDSDNVTIKNNIVYNWSSSPPLSPPDTVRDPALEMLSSDVRVTNIFVENNVFQQPDGGYLLRVDDSKIGDVATVRNNTYWSGSDESYWWFNANRASIFSRSGETDYVIGEVEFEDPARDIRTYMDSLDKENSLEAFIAEAYKQSRYNYRDEYTAYAVNDYIREGFEMNSVTVE
tara:strand:- start:11111 stop:14332 length:3222 start_codon:yes stop_codon:yes gene_type:complete